MSNLRISHTAPWPTAPDIRGRDLVYIAMLTASGLGVLFGAISLLSMHKAGAPVSASTPDFGEWPDQDFTEFWMQHVLIGAFYAYLTLLVYTVLIRPRHQSWHDLGFRRFDVKWLAMTIALGGLLFVAGEWLTRLLELTDQAGAYNRDLFVPKNAGALLVIVEILLIGLATAVIEEAGFRGLLHRWIRQKVNRPVGLVLSAAIFSVCHFGFVDPGGVLGWYWTAEVFVFGIMLALLLEWSGSLWPSILLHATNNAAAVILAHLAG